MTPRGLPFWKRLVQAYHEGFKYTGTMGMGHTRWATQGYVSEQNAHPQLSNDQHFAIVHNDIIENYKKIQQFLQERGYTFYSETDTEVLVNLIDYHYRWHNTQSFLDIVRKSLYNTVLQ